MLTLDVSHDVLQESALLLASVALATGWVNQQRPSGELKKTLYFRASGTPCSIKPARRPRSILECSYCDY